MENTLKYQQVPRHKELAASFSLVSIKILNIL